MSNDPSVPGGQPPVPPIAGGADPTLPGGADPTLAQPVQPHYTTGPGVPPERAVPPPGTGEGGPGGPGGSGGSGGGAGHGDDGAGRPAWLVPAAVGLAGVVVIAVVAFLLLRGDGDDSIASESSTTAPAAATTDPAGGDTTLPTGADTTVASDVATTLPPDGSATTVPAAATTVPDGAGATTVPADGDGSDPCADGYTEVTALPFGLCSQGQVVRDAQFVIAEVTPIDVDGFYGPTSFAAVQQLQTSLGLPADGIVNQELLDAVQGPVDPAGFAVASPGTVRVFDREFPIVRTCRTIPFEGRTADYQVISYVYADEFGTSVIDRWFDEGGASGVYFFDANDVTELSEGFAFEFVEGDGVVPVSVNPVDAPSDACVGRVVQTDGGGEQTRVFSVASACSNGTGAFLQLSEGATITQTDQGPGSASVLFGTGPAESFFFGEDPGATVSSDGGTISLNATIESQGDTRTFSVSYPSNVPAC